jgi:hypothetical protein
MAGSLWAIGIKPIKNATISDSFESAAVQLISRAAAICVPISYTSKPFPNSIRKEPFYLFHAVVIP